MSTPVLSVAAAEAGALKSSSGRRLRASLSLLPTAPSLAARALPATPSYTATLLSELAANEPPCALDAATLVAIFDELHSGAFRRVHEHTMFDRNSDQTLSKQPQRASVPAAPDAGAPQAQFLGGVAPWEQPLSAAVAPLVAQPSGYQGDLEAEMFGARAMSPMPLAPASPAAVRSPERTKKRAAAELCDITPPLPPPQALSSLILTDPDFGSASYHSDYMERFRTAFEPLPCPDYSDDDDDDNLAYEYAHLLSLSALNSSDIFPVTHSAPAGPAAPSAPSAPADNPLLKAPRAQHEDTSIPTLVPRGGIIAKTDSCACTGPCFSCSCIKQNRPCTPKCGCEGATYCAEGGHGIHEHRAKILCHMKQNEQHIRDSARKLAYNIASLDTKRAKMLAHGELAEDSKEAQESGALIESFGSIAALFAKWQEEHK